MFEQLASKVPYTDATLFLVFLFVCFFFLSCEIRYFLILIVDRKVEPDRGGVLVLFVGIKFRYKYPAQTNFASRPARM